MPDRRGSPARVSQVYRVPTIRPRPPVPAVLEPEKKRRWWAIPFSWFREEAFWRDVTKSAFSTGVVALIAYVYAVGAGYISTPTGRQTVMGALSAVAPFFIGLAVGGISGNHRLARRFPILRRPLNWLMPVFLATVLILALLITVNAIWPLPFWPENLPFR